ncbi:hypothetical protein WBJ53_15025 [Spirosoma sp. SC4-14]|uniref:hypothetical protein n=1 Tax=Spirosoma sp. SC4-14 TaxID=3128900 RepID=UPI0030D3A5A1
MISTKLIWTPQQDQFLRDHYEHYSARELAIRLGLKFGAVRKRILALGLKKSPEAKRNHILSLSQHKEDRWSDDELTFLRTNYALMSKSQIGKHLGRSQGSVSYQVFRLGLTKSKEQARALFLENRFVASSSFTPEEDQFITAHWTSMSKADIAKAIGRNRREIVMSRGHKLGLTLSQTERKSILQKGSLKRDDIFSDEEITYIREHFTTLPIRSIAKAICRPIRSVRDKANALGLTLTQEALDAKRAHPDFYPDSFIARAITRDPDLLQEVLNTPNLIKLKRLQIHLNRKIKQL